MRMLSVLAIAISVALSCAPAPAQPASGAPSDRQIDSAERAAVIDAVLGELDRRYVFPETAQKMSQAIRDRQKKKEYDSVTSGEQFAKVLTENLQEVSHDKHLRVRHSAENIPPPPANQGPPSKEDRERQRRQAARLNFGFEKIERLSGNVGYLDFRAFMSPEAAGETAVAAMNFVANTDALIIDMRKNGGGDPAMVALVCSYLFDDVVHLNDLYWRPENTTHQWWTLPVVQGRRFGRDKPVYVLTSNRTFSAAEEFTYNLQNLKRATIVGETTGGGAHPGGFARLSDHFGAFIPSGRAINPISKTNWEGTGVKPDMPVNAELALKTAHLDALKKLLDRETDERAKGALRDSIKVLEKELASGN